jgi:carbon-monoxide dehydrogenase medium subunit
MTTTLADNEVVTAIVVPVAARGQSSAYVKFSHPASRYAVIGIAASVTLANNQCAAARVALGGLVSHACRAAAVEKALVGKGLDAATIAAAAGQVGADLGGEVSGDIFASASYRKAVAPVYVRRAIAAAAARAGLA